MRSYIRTIRFTVDEALILLLNFIKNEVPQRKNILRVRIVESKNCYIRAKTWNGLESLTVRIVPRDGRSEVHLNFDNSGLIAVWSIILIISLLIDLTLLRYRYPIAGNLTLLMSIEAAWVYWFSNKKIEIFMEELDSYINNIGSKGLLGRAEEKPRPELSPETLHLYQRLIDRYSRIYGRSISALEYRIEEYMWEGLSREEAITRLAEEEGVT